MRANKWLEGVTRIKIPRENKAENLRLDRAERTINYNEDFFARFMKTLTQEDFILYPSYEEYEQLQGKIASQFGLESKNIYLATGSDMCIKDMIQVTCTQGSEVVSSVPCYPMYYVYAETVGANFIRVPYDDDGTFDINLLMAAVNNNTRLVVLTNPNSPYGDHKGTFEIEPLCRFLEKRGITLLIDEAYVDYSPGSCMELVKKYKNTIISRTFSKAWGAAGSRAGYLVADEGLISLVSRVQTTYPITGAGIKFISFLLDNRDEVENYVEQTIRDRDLLCDLLEDAGYDVLRSHTNSIHLHETNGDNQKTVGILDKHGVAFKCGGRITGTMVNVPGDPRTTWVRLSVGPGIQGTEFIREILGDI